jgi:NUMOD4 motif-containing protein/NUMOD1 domain-containing protein
MKAQFPYQQFSLADMKGEEWDDIPFLDGAYLISNYGRIKTVKRWVQINSGGAGYWLKERIRKVRVSSQLVSGGKRKLTRLAATLQFEGKPFGVSIARLVYCLFVKAFELEDRTLLVVCKDGNPFNIRPDNLQLITSSASATKAYRLGHRPLDSFKNKASVVWQYDLEGKLAGTFPSINAAAKACKIQSSGISKAIHTSNSYCGGYIWKQGKSGKAIIPISRYAKEKLASQRLHSSVVSQYDLDGRKLKEHQNLTTAARAVKIQLNQIRQVMLGKKLSAAGYFWTLGKGPKHIALNHLKESRLKWERKICRPITQYSMTGDRIGNYPSQAEAARQLAISVAAISSALRYKTLTVGGGYFWRYDNGPARIEIPERLKRRYALQRFYEQPVTQYDRQGRRIAVYSDVKSAARAVHADRHGLVAALTGKLLSCADCYWRLGKGKARIDVDAENNAQSKYLRKISRPVVQYSASGKKIMTYPSMADARRATGVSESNIGRVLAGKAKMAKGFIWKVG